LHHNNKQINIMKTLWDKLSEENKKKLEETKRLYPTTATNLINALKSEVAWTSLKMEHVMYLLQDTNSKRFDINPLTDLFDGK
jgi:hypothetical protein